MTIDKFILAHGLSMTAAPTDRNQHMDNMDDSDKMDHWRCRMRCGRRSYTVTFSMGHGHAGRQPELAEVIDFLADDAVSAEEEWAHNLGFDSDSPRAASTYRAILRTSRRLARLLGEDAYKQLLWHTDRL